MRCNGRKNFFRFLDYLALQPNASARLFSDLAHRTHACAKTRRSTVCVNTWRTYTPPVRYRRREPTNRAREHHESEELARPRGRSALPPSSVTRGALLVNVISSSRSARVTQITRLHPAPHSPHRAPWRPPFASSIPLTASDDRSLHHVHTWPRAMPRARPPPSCMHERPVRSRHA